MKWKKIAYKMAEEIAMLRRARNIEWGEYNPEDYEEETIIKEYIKEVVKNDK